MNKLFGSKAMSWVLLALVFVLMVMSFDIRMPWWCFIDEFFAFMMAFVHLLSVYLREKSPAAARKLDIFAIVFGVLMFVFFFVEYIALNNSFGL